ncbi:snaclec 3-like [Patiria miniata]|uniref:C-type lectin n=1 Tax=Patiria miniata TaxID=46514 RepID=A0A914BBL3_PATMI|nr:snaclec 3-like [Patiria miniata]
MHNLLVIGLKVVFLVVLGFHVVLCRGGCPDGFTYFEYSCYKIHVSPELDWPGARDACAAGSNGSHLVYIHSEAEQSFLRGLALEASAGSGVHLWIGVTAAVNGSLEWLDGSRLTYTAWDEDGPRANGRDCVRLRPDKDYLWNDRFCYIMYGYICEQASSSCHATSTDFTRPTSVGMAATSDEYLIRSTMTSSLSRCSHVCSKNEDCKSFNYDVASAPGKRTCELFSAVFEDSEMEARPGFAYYKPN